MSDLSALFAVLDTLAPIFLLVLLGAALRCRGFLTAEVSEALNRLVFWCALPSLLFTSLAASTLDRGSFATAAVLMLATGLVALLAWGAAPGLSVSTASRGAFTQAAFRGNNAFVGLPVILMAYAGHPQEGTVKSVAMLTMAPCLILYNVLAVFVLTPVDSRRRHRVLPWGRIARGIATNPLILACLAGVAAMALRPAIPLGLSRTMTSLGALAGPGALLALGASLTRERLRTALRLAHWAALLKLVVCPLIGWGLARLFRLGPDATFVALIYLACPTAVASFVMAQAMNGDAPLAGGTVALSTVYAVLSLGLILLLAGPR